MNLAKYENLFYLFGILLLMHCSINHAAKITVKQNTSDISALSAFASSPSETYDDAVSEVNASEEAETEDAAAEEKTAVTAITDTSALSVWGIVRGIWNWVKDDLKEGLFGDYEPSETKTSVTGRTFGKIRRLQMALIPIIFKFGLLTAMVAFLVVLSMKTLFLLKVLILMNVAVILGKFLTFKSSLGSVEHTAPAAWNYGSWNPHVHSGWAEPAPSPHFAHAPSKEIHLHIHGAQSHGAHPQVSAYSTYTNAVQPQHGWDRKYDPYSLYEPAPVRDAASQAELINTSPIYPTNHRSY